MIDDRGRHTDPYSSVVGAKLMSVRPHLLTPSTSRLSTLVPFLNSESRSWLWSVSGPDMWKSVSRGAAGSGSGVRSQLWSRSSLIRHRRHWSHEHRRPK
jgi:hypothetical protein